ncbi:MAG: response regulator [Oscillospiraceae bacterium]|nr:response regulator [Oscillospiraceae bacterium]
MYSCCVRFYLIGEEKNAFDKIKNISPLENFTHKFYESVLPEVPLIHEADVIIACIRGEDAEKSVKTVISSKKNDSELIVIAEKESVPMLMSMSESINDIWVLPMSVEEVCFRFSKWQQSKKAKMDLWENSYFFEATMNSSPNLIWFKTKDGVHERVNDSFCRTVNKTKQQVQGQRHAYIWDVEEDDIACIESEREVMNSGKILVSEESIQTKDGQKLLTTYKSPLYNCDGSVMGTVGIGVDITREREFEQEMMKKSRSLEKVFTSLDCGVLCHSLDGRRIIRINNAALRILGYESRQELEEVGFNMVAASVLDEDKVRIKERIMMLTHEGDSINVEYRVRNKEGKLIHVMGNIKLLKENGELFYQRFMLDITAQKMQEQESERKQAELIHALSIEYHLVCYFNLDTGIGHSLRIYNCKHDVLDNIFPIGHVLILEDSLGRYIDTCVHEEDREMMHRVCSRRWLREQLNEKKMCTVNYKVMCGDKLKYFQMRAVRTGEETNQWGIVMGFHNVDDETRAEMEQKSLLESALVQANRASEAKSVFLSNMSHDIRTPMNAIVGFTSLALSHIDDNEKTEEYLKKIMVSGNHLLSLINDILDMSRIESGKMHIEEAPCSIPEIVQGIQNILQEDINAKQQELIIETVDITDEYIFCDKLRLNQVLLNLLNNSVKYTNSGGKITLRVSENRGTSEDRAIYEFLVKDTGIGMSGEFLKHIFEPFERERNSTISGIQGTGLGMAITKNIVDLMNGTIEVTSEEGVGTECVVRFVFRLNKGKTDSEPEEKKTADKIRTGRILLAEDNELNQEIATVILEEAGFEVEVADNGQIAVEKLKASEPGYYRIILMDIQMPVMNGYEASSTIRSLDNKELASIPIIAMTANAFEEDKQEALKNGMNGHIAKPIDVKVLFDTLDKLLS